MERFLVGGVNSPVRAFRQVGDEPLVLTEGRGAFVRGTDGRRYLDFIMGWGALVLGHQPPAVMQALKRAAARGTILGLTHPAEGELAQLIAEAVPSVEQVRFTVSGTEACMTAIRLARAHTGRARILMFEGSYHGHADSVMAGKTSGIPDAIAKETLTIPFNDAEALDAALARFGPELACVIVEPVAANMGVVPPARGFLQQIQSLTSRHGVILIFDEVVTGFRLGLAGAQGTFSIRPDLTTFGKIIGGGLPVGALGGPRHLMRHLAPEGEVYHGGTFAGHPLTMAAGVATLRALRAHPPYAQLERLARALAEGLMDEARRAHVPVQINRMGAMVTLFFSEHPVTDAATAKRSDRGRFAQWVLALRADGMLIAPSPFEAIFVSTAHTVRHIERVLLASREAFNAMRGQ